MREAVSIFDWPYTRTVIGIMQAVDFEAFNVDPIGCRCVLKMPTSSAETEEPTLSSASTSTGSNGGNEPGTNTPQEPFESAIPEFDYLRIKHSECCVDNECVEYVSCKAILTKDNGNGQEVVGEIPGECKKFEGTGPEPDIGTGGHYRRPDGSPIL